MNKSITAHMIVKNEDRFIWYAISSVLPYVDKFLIFDTGSTDRTVEIIKLFHDKKIIFKQKGEVTAKEIAKLRQEQIEMTKTPWLWIVDGDEIYPEKTIRRILSIVGGKRNYDGVIVHRYDLLGDIYHCQDETVGEYEQFLKKGHYVLRLINKGNIKGLQVLGEYPNEYFADKDGLSIKERGMEHFAFVEERIFHAMYLKRSSVGRNLFNVFNRNKWKVELGRGIPRDEVPEVFFQERPKILSEVTKKRSWFYILLAMVVTPVKVIKRKIWQGFKKMY